MTEISADPILSAREAALERLLAEPDFPGWSRAALAAVLRRHGEAEAEATRLFPGGALDMIDAFTARADRLMVAHADLTGRGLTGRVRALLAARLAVMRPHKEAVRHALGRLALRRHRLAALRLLARSMDAIWHAAGDEATDFSWYTKRATLAGIYSATLLYWLADASPDDAATLAFLDRRLAGLKTFGQWRARLQTRLPFACGTLAPS
ncbi:COQ9 family protein [Acidibrevibacterium fodinaquatile]|uniref:COQ9 family protein n=1 Tax=Acidibrevibacterium fodinaquatile TaxID=1969806 RepID=UPI000E0DC6EB|nr:COQ9 family protein [Acidibrevibacterium fodinaquatile]